MIFQVHKDLNTNVYLHTNFDKDLQTNDHDIQTTKDDKNIQPQIFMLFQMKFIKNYIYTFKSMR